MATCSKFLSPEDRHCVFSSTNPASAALAIPLCAIPWSAKPNRALTTSAMKAWIAPGIAGTAIPSEAPVKTTGSKIQQLIGAVSILADSHAFTPCLTLIIYAKGVRLPGLRPTSPHASRQVCGPNRNRALHPTGKGSHDTHLGLRLDR